jgi:hypothetical protein
LVEFSFTAVVAFDIFVHPLTFLGLYRGDAFDFTVFGLPAYVLFAFGVIMYSCLVKNIYISHRAKGITVMILFIHIFFTAFASREWYGIRYLFGVMPLFILGIGLFFEKYKFIFFIWLCFLVLVYAKIYFGDISINSTHYTFPSLSTIQLAAKRIASDNPTVKYNVSENITGDARALYLRFFVDRDVALHPKSVFEYGDLDRLYILTPSIEKTTRERRWEFTATPNLQLTSKVKINDVFLLRYDRMK